MSERTSYSCQDGERVFQAKGRTKAKPRGRNKFGVFKGDRKKACAIADEASVGENCRK